MTIHAPRPPGRMAQKIASTGRIALFGMLSDFNRTDIKPESTPTLQEIAKLMKESGGA